MALDKGVELAKDLGISKLLIQLDNLACVQLLQSKDIGSSECSHLLKNVIKLIEDTTWTVHISHVYREGNRAADWLANQGVAQHIRIQIFSSPPIDLCRILLEDSRGVAFPRLIPS